MFLIVNYDGNFLALYQLYGKKILKNSSMGNKDKKKNSLKDSADG